MKKKNLIIAFLVLILCFSITSMLVINSYAKEVFQDYGIIFTPYKIKNYNDKVEITDPNTNKITIKGDTFIPEKSGVYTINNGNSITNLKIFATIPKSNFEFSNNLNAEYGTGEKIVLPYAKINSEVIKNANYYIFVEKNNAIINTLYNGGGEILSLEKGDYNIIYAYTDIFGYITSKYFSFSVTDKPVFTFVKLNALAYGKATNLNQEYICIGDKKEFATIKITDCDGIDVELVNNIFVANKLGSYTIEYTGVIDNTEYTTSYVVESKVLSSNLFEGVALSKAINGNVELPQYSLTKGSGVELVGVSEGATFRYANIIDLNMLDATKNLISFMPNVKDDKSWVEKVEIILTDAYNKDNKVSFYLKQSPFHDNYVYITASNKGRHYCFDNENYGKNGMMKIGDKYFFGGLMRNDFSFKGGVKKDARMFSLSFDYLKKQAIVDLTNYPTDGRMVMVDFDDPDWVGGSEYVWNGFTTGEVELSIEFGNIHGVDPSLIVTEIMGQNISGVLPADNEAPSIFIDLDDEYKPNLPYGVVEQNYTIPKAIANDIICGEIVISRQILYGENKEVVSYDGDVFKPKKAGRYEILYTATDAFENTSVSSLYFEVFATKPEIIVEMQNVSNIKMNTYLKIPKFTVRNASGKINEEVIVSYNNKIIKPDEANKIYIDKIGAIDLDVKITDYLGNIKNEKFSIEIKPELPSLIIKDMPSIAVKGQKLFFQQPFLTDFANKENSTIAIKIIVNGKEIKENEYLVKANDEVINVQYLVNINGAEITKDYTITVTDGNAISDFVKHDGNIITDNFGTVFEFTNSGSLEFISPVSQSELLFRFLVGEYNFSSLDITMTDYNNPNIAVLLKITKHTDKLSKLMVNGIGDNYILNGSISSGSELYFIYNSDSHLFKDAVGKPIFELKKCLNGDVFKGFESGGVKIKIKLNDVTKKSSVKIIKISNQVFSNYGFRNVDITPAVITTKKEKNYEELFLNTKYTIDKTLAFDVLHGITEASVTVIDPNNNIIIDNEYLKETREIIFNKYGYYTISYKATDSVGNASSKDITIKIFDNIAPEIKVDGNYLNKYKLKDTIKINSATIQDNKSENSKFYVIIKTPNYQTTILELGSEYTFKLYGEYKIIYYAVDDDDNVSRIEYSMEVA